MFTTIDVNVMLLFLLYRSPSLAYQNVKAPVVSLPEGRIQGHVLESPIGNKRYYAYQEIPYASPPIGNLRLKEPVAPRRWDGILNATQNSRSCFLSGITSEKPPNVFETEDCLYLNVYTPAKPGSHNCGLPVFFWIHGGGFYFGDGTFQTYGPQYLIDYDVIIVTINYRLGAFGFLTTEDSVISGNMGLKDQNLALKWVQKNIALFGGDPKKVTIVGESSGGASVGYHLLSKKSKGLFRGGILQSGTAIGTESPLKNRRNFAFNVGKLLDSSFTSESSRELLKLLQTPSADVLNNITKFNDGDPIVWNPVLESEDYEGAFLTGLMYENIRTGNINRVPILLGYNSEESLVFFTDDDVLRKTAADMDNDLSRIVSYGYNMTEEDMRNAGKLLRRLYTKDTFQKNLTSVIRYLSDANFTTPTIRHAELQSKYTDVYLYQFAYKGRMGNLLDVIRPGLDTVAHSEDLRYLWLTDIFDDGTVYPQDDKLTQQRVLKLWSNFVKYLNPTPERDSLFQNGRWPKIAPGNIVYLNINKTFEVRTDPRQYRQFTAIVDKYAVPPLNSY